MSFPGCPVSSERQRALDLSRGLEPSPTHLDRVARQTGPEAARWAFSQWNLRRRGHLKGLPHAEELLYVAEALEQGTHFAVAEYHASLFPRGVLVADLGCGIGCDAMALAGRGPLLAIEADPERLSCAVHNLRVCGLEAETRNADGLATEWNFRYAFADPARRLGGRRTLNPAEFEPNPARLAGRMAELELGVLKLSPLLQDAYLQGLGPCLQFVSHEGECKEALVLCGSTSVPGRWAVQIGVDAPIPEAYLALKSEYPGAYLYEADPAAIRAHSLGSIPGADSMSLLGDSNGYLTSASHLNSSWVKSYRVLDSGRFDVKSVRAKLGAMNRGCTVVKSRAKGADAASVLKQVRIGGERQAILVVYPVLKSVRYALVEPI